MPASQPVLVSGCRLGLAKKNGGKSWYSSLRVGALKPLPTEAFSLVSLPAFTQVGAKR
jgi:hypothetical protein